MLDCAELKVNDAYVSPSEIQAYGDANFGKKFKGSKALARVVVGYTSDGKNVKLFEGKLEGTIGEPLGQKGFGWDNIFYPNGYDFSLASMIEHKHVRQLFFLKKNSF